MAGNRFTQRRVQDKYEALTMDEMLAPINSMQKNHNDLDLAAGATNASLTSNFMEADRELVEGYNNEISQNISSISDRLASDGYSSDLYQELKTLKRERDSLYSSTGDIGRAETEYNNQLLNKTNTMSNTKLSGVQQRDGLNMAKKNYEAAGGVGGGAIYEDYVGVDSVDIMKEAVDLGNKMNPSEILKQTGWYQGAGGWQNDNETTKELTQEEITRVVANAIGEDFEIKSYLDELEAINSITAEEREQMLIDAAEASGGINKVYDYGKKSDFKNFGKYSGAGGGGSDSDAEAITINAQMADAIITEGFTADDNHETRNKTAQALRDSQNPADQNLGRFLQEKTDASQNKFDTDPKTKSFRDNIKNKAKTIEKYAGMANMSSEDFSAYIFGNSPDNDFPVPQWFVPKLYTGAPQTNIYGNVIDKNKDKNYIMIGRDRNDQPIKVFDNEKGYDKLKNMYDLYNSKKFEGFRKIAKEAYSKQTQIGKPRGIWRNAEPLQEARELYKKGFDKFLSEVEGGFEDQEVSYSQSGGNNFDKELKEPLQDALLRGNEVFSVTKKNGERVNDNDLTELKVIQQMDPKNVSVRTINDTGHGRPSITITGMIDDKQVSYDLTLNDINKGTGGQTTSFQEQFFDALKDVKDPETNKTQYAPAGYGASQNMKDDLEYAGLYSTDDDNKDLSEELKKNARFGKDAVDNIRTVMNLGPNGTMAVHKIGTASYNIRTGSNGKSTPATPNSMAALTGIPVSNFSHLNSGTHDDPIDFANSATAFKMLKVISKIEFKK